MRFQKARVEQWPSSGIVSYTKTVSRTFYVSTPCQPRELVFLIFACLMHSRINHVCTSWLNRSGVRYTLIFPLISTGGTGGAGFEVCRAQHCACRPMELPPAIMAINHRVPLSVSINGVFSECSNAVRQPFTPYVWPVAVHAISNRECRPPRTARSRRVKFEKRGMFVSLCRRRSRT